MKPTLNVYGLPRYADPSDLEGTTAVVIDVLRAATTMAYALNAGATEIAPFRDISDALKLAESLPADSFVLGGERDGLAIDGFHLGNSPEEYTADQVAGKLVIMTTTNGTRAIEHARCASEVLIASFVNVSATVSYLVEREKISIICAGTDGRISEDDVLLAGMLVERLQRQSGLVYQQNSQAITAREFWINAFALPQAIGAEPLPAELLAAQLRKSQGALNLLQLGLDADILAASQIDLFDVVPAFDPLTGRIRNATKD